MRYKVYISQVWTYSTEIEADSREEADAIAGEIANEVTPKNTSNPLRRMAFGDQYVEVEPIKEEKNGR